MSSNRKPDPIRGRGARENIAHRFSRRTRVIDPEWNPPSAGRATQVSSLTARRIISRNRSPDVGFNQSLNPYQGCEHGCVYCFARPSHAYHDLSPGLDFETHILAKTNAAECLRRELASDSYECEPLAVGVNTDAYQPAERRLKITRGVLEACLEMRQPLVLITKSSLILRDLDLLSELAARKLVRVSVSLTTLDAELKRRLEPRTAGPTARLGVITSLRQAGVPAGAMLAPVIPKINDCEIERILAAAAEHGAIDASYVLLRLPLEVEPLFRDWLAAHFPDRAQSVMNAVRSCHHGKSYDSRFHARMRGHGVVADLIAQRFAVARRRYGLDRSAASLDTSRFRKPGGAQLPLFG
jgi:DNA repair photolyase